MTPKRAVREAASAGAKLRRLVMQPHVVFMVVISLIAIFCSVYVSLLSEEEQAYAIAKRSTERFTLSRLLKWRICAISFSSTSSRSSNSSAIFQSRADRMA